MKKIAAAAAIALGLTISSTIAAPVLARPYDRNINPCEECRKKHMEEFKKDPVKFLEEKKSRILKLQKEGRIDKDAAKKAIEKIDKKIEEIKEFQKLPVEKKRETVISKYKERMDELIRKGKITKEEAEKKTKEFVEKINKWDGTGYPMFHER